MSAISKSIDSRVLKAGSAVARWALGVAAIAVLAAAGPVCAATVWYQGSVQMIYPMNDGSFAIAVPSILPTCSGNGSGGVYLYVTPGQNGVVMDGLKNMLATLLTAFSTGRTISIAYDNSTASC